ncbi:PhnD/SsuA/transferrin family substrate-binding protein [Methylovulum psychrotolerans]|jgi:hypothetical protein|uniref:Phosphate ABC transporter substrate-binding protein n=1 Tax=Methylovulum psychrotolerans TaxID=1704499 RepID=A0A1Z4BXR1_9GAMM|nr:hypothetical protein [Methylovulum psychrotolerans]ASF46065.1 hypothetical protein CEK71_08215 [Methylovulum psychrotolerans]MBT9099767.1 hypothetical protein [Methylovulum psychrotolerans]
MMIKHPTIFRQWRAWISVVLWALLSIPIAPAGTPETVFFYNPESSVDNFAALKAEFDDYLSKQGAYSFQPFSERNTFEVMLAGKPQGVYLLSSWHYLQLNAKTPLEAKLVGTAKGEPQQRKILTAKDIDNIPALAGATIAGAGSEDYLRSQLQQMLGASYAALMPKIKLLSVPKDIDALMAVSFGMASAALSSENSLNKLALINPKQHAQLKTLASGEKSFLLIAAVAKPSQSDAQPLLKIIETMQQQPDGEKNLKMLGLDGWKRIDALDTSLVKQLRLP